MEIGLGSFIQIRSINVVIIMLVKFNSIERLGFWNIFFSATR